MPTVIKSDYYVYLAYSYSEEINDGNIYYLKYDIITGISNSQNKSIIKKLNIYPNPIRTQTTIEFITSKEQRINVSLYNLNGQHIKTFMNENTQPGKYSIIWNGKDQNGKEVKPGLYLVRLQSGRNIVTKPVEMIQ